MNLTDLPQDHQGGSGASNSFIALAHLDQAALDAFPQAVYLCASDGRVIRFNDKAVELWGRTPHVGDPQERYCGSLRLYRTDGSLLPHDQCPVATALDTGEIVQSQEVVVERPDGRRLTVLVNIAPVKDSHGHVNGAINCFQDISDRKGAEERHRDLVMELNHRIKNTLATVHSMATFTARDASSVEDFTSRFEARLVALSHVHALLSACEQAGASIRDLLAKQLEPFGAGENGRVRFKGPPVRLEPDTALGLCMVFHELMTNAAKYGPLSVDDGRVSIEWDVRSDPHHDGGLRLQWFETGGPPVERPDRAGFGTRLIRRIIAGLGGEPDFRFEPSGLQFQADIPLAASEMQSARS
jgi:two-component sensor histidine kinase